ncbi:MAG: hypothetical protein AB1631_19820 [Acidobacteriota bacterium]
MGKPVTLIAGHKRDKAILLAVGNNGCTAFVSVNGRKYAVGFEAIRFS